MSGGVIINNKSDPWEDSRCLSCQYLSFSGPSNVLLATVDQKRPEIYIIPISQPCFKGTRELTEYISQGLLDATKKAAVLLTHRDRTCSGGYDQNADRVFYLEDGPIATTKLTTTSKPFS
jgi:hypothetical protein